MTGGTRSYEMAKRLVRDGHSVEMITTDRDRDSGGKQWRVTNEDGITVHWLSVPYSQNMHATQRIRAFLVFAVRSTFKACSLRVDLVFATSTPLTIAIPAMIAKTFQRVPFVFEIRDIWPKAAIAVGMLKNPLAIAIAKWLEKLAYKKADKIIVLAPYFSEEINRLGISERKQVLIPNACDIDFFNSSIESANNFRNSYEWLGDRPMLLFAGSMGRLNNLEYVVQLAKYTIKIDPEIRFLLVGSGSEEMSIRELAKETEVYEKNLFMLPPVKKLDLPPILKAATVCSAFSIDKRELWLDTCNKIFDAWAAERPTVVNYGGYQTEIALESGAGLRLAPVVDSSVAQILVNHMRDADWLGHASTAARSLANERFSRESLYQKLHTTLSEFDND